MSENEKKAILAIDQGTTSSRAIVFGADGAIIATSQYEFAQHYPFEGWVEHDPEEIWQTILKATREAYSEAVSLGYQVVTIGITNQRETTVIWDKETGKPIHKAIVWQDRRTAQVCEKLKADGHEDTVKSKTGLLLDPYFSASKAAWILDNTEGARALAADGKLAFGTIDSFLVWRLTGGAVHATDTTNASRTSLFNIHDLAWDDALLDVFNVPRTMLPDVRQSSDDYGVTMPELLGVAVPIQGVAGDQQAAAVGQCCFHEGDVKSTYGTGCFVLLNTGPKCVPSQHKLLSTIAYTIDGQTAYALEGSIFMAGATMQWLRDELGVIKNAVDSGKIAAKLSDCGGVVLVPAFTGLGAPHWDAEARAAIFGMTRGSNSAYLIRAALESVCYQTSDLFDAMEKDGLRPVAVKVDGGMVANDWLLDFLANILKVPVDRPVILETTALGAAFLAGLKAGLFVSLEEISRHRQSERLFQPSSDFKDRDVLLNRWHKAVACARDFGS